MKLTFVLNNIQKNCLTNILYVIACYDWENSQATSIDLDCHIVHVCSSIYLDYYFIYAYALLLIQNLNVINVQCNTRIYDLLVFICSHVHASLRGSDWQWRNN